MLTRQQGNAPVMVGILLMNHTAVVSTYNTNRVISYTSMVESYSLQLYAQLKKKWAEGGQFKCLEVD